jgi:hypothetical protein
MIKIILKENQLLNEVTVEQAIATLNSKATRKLIYKYIEQEKQEYFNQYKKNHPERSDEEIIKDLWQSIGIKPSEEAIHNRVVQLMNYIHKTIPRDLTDNQKGLCVLWLKREFLFSYQGWYNIFVLSDFDSAYVKHLLERFFQFYNFIEPQEKRDLNRVSDFQELAALIKDARPRFQAYQEKQAYLNADEGTEYLGEKNGYDIYIAHNKGAACKLGKGTDWCTAAPGLDYFKSYYKEYDPLFIFINKSEPEDKYQFHYGTKQFMDQHDSQVNGGFVRYLHNLLVSIPNIEKRYPILYDTELPDETEQPIEYDPDEPENY